MSIKAVKGCDDAEIAGQGHRAQLAGDRGDYQGGIFATSNRGQEAPKGGIYRGAGQFINDQPGATITPPRCRIKRLAHERLAMIRQVGPIGGFGIVAQNGPRKHTISIA
ncbi:MAG: hypothetical protein AB4911_05525 [Oscillochloridaceae bacterium umkhey_bin13]